MTIEEIMKIMSHAKDLGVNIKVDGIEVLTRGEEKPVNHSPVPELKAEDIIKPISILDDITEDEILYYSSPYYDEMMAQKEAHKEAIKNGTTQGEE